MSAEGEPESRNVPDQLLYLDNAATSYPKAPGVVEAVVEHLRDIAGNAGRGTHTFAAMADRSLLGHRQAYQGQNWQASQACLSEDFLRRRSRLGGPCSAESRA